MGRKATAIKTEPKISVGTSSLSNKRQRSDGSSDTFINHGKVFGNEKQIDGTSVYTFGKAYNRKRKSKRHGSVDEKPRRQLLEDDLAGETDGDRFINYGKLYGNKKQIRGKSIYEFGDGYDEESDDNTSESSYDGTSDSSEEIMEPRRKRQRT